MNQHAQAAPARFLEAKCVGGRRERIVAWSIVAGWLISGLLVTAQTGFAQPSPRYVAVATHDVAPLDSMRFGMPADQWIGRGALVRELVRQAFLLSAHEELQQDVRDQSLGDDLGGDDKPPAFPYEIQTQVDDKRELTIEIVRKVLNEEPFQRRLEPFQLSGDRYYESLLEYMEGLSRTEFPKLLRESGVKGKANTFHDSAKVTPEIESLLSRFDEVSQLAAIRELHRLIRDDGESPERLAALSGAYANLGSLTECHWRIYHKVFKARGLLYAQRLVAVAKGSPASIAQRGYAWALAGRPQTALDDLKSAVRKELTESVGLGMPSWVRAVRAYCEFDQENMNSENEGEGALVAYLRMMASDPTDSQVEYIERVQAFLERSPGCALASLALGEVHELSIQRMLAEGGFQAAWPGVYQSLSQVPGLSKEAAELIEAQVADGGVQQNEPADRVRLMELLKSATHEGAGPSGALAGMILEDVSFFQAVYQLWVRESMLDLPVDDLRQELAPIVATHPYAAYVRHYHSNTDDARQELGSLVADLPAFELDLNAQTLIVDSYYRISQQAYNRLYPQAVNHEDFLQPDLLRQLNYISRAPDSKDFLANPVKMLNRVSPHLPLAVSRRIDFEGPGGPEQASELEEKFRRSPRVLESLAAWHSSRGAFEDAERCLQRRVELSPETRSYQLLANVYATSNDRVKWKEAMLRALETPSFGLDHARIEVAIADYHMDRNEWDEAKPFATAAAQTYSAWGLQCAARCYEGLGDYVRAESLIQSCARRYDYTAQDWFFWCLRTGRGNEREARAYAEQRLNRFEQLGVGQRMDLALYRIAMNETAAAQEIFEKSFQQDRNQTFEGTMAALLLATMGDVRQRDSMLDLVTTSVNASWTDAALAELILKFVSGPEGVQWDEVEFRRILASGASGAPTNYYFFAGRFLQLQGQDELGLQYLRSAASSTQFPYAGCFLATVELQRQKQEIPQRRLTELDGDLAEFHPVKQEMIAWTTARKYDRVVEVITQFQAEHEDWAFLLGDRGLAYERLGKYAEAIADYERATELDPKYRDAHHALAMIRGACHDPALRDPAQAMIHAQRAFDLTRVTTYANHACLAIAYAANGDFEKAVENQQLALRTWPNDAQHEGFDRLKLFQEKKPYVRQPPAAP